MKDVVYPLQKAYAALLNGIMYDGNSVPVFYQYLPDDDTSDVYIIFGSITDNDTSTMNTQGSRASIKVKIHTWKDKYNDGTAVAAIAGQVLERINPINGPMIDLSGDGLQLFSTKKTNDATDDWTVNGQKVYIDRTLQFSHNIHYL